MRKYVVKQENMKDCGVACLLSIIKYYKGYVGFEKLREMTKTDRNGTTAFHLKQTLINLGFNCQVVKCENLFENSITIPCIAHVVINKSYNHYVVVYKIDKSKKTITIMDPSYGYKKLNQNEFYKIWTNNLIMFYPIKKIPKLNQKQNIMKFSKKLIYPHKPFILSIIFFSILFTMLSIINSFYFKYIIDSINEMSLKNFYLISTIFLIIVVIKIMIDFIRNRLLIYINKKIDTALFTDAIDHIISLPYNYYKNRTSGEIISRINDLSYVRDMISRVAMILFVDIILVTLTLVFLYILNAKLFVICISIAVFYIIIVILFNKVLQKFIDINLEQQAQLTSAMIESINAFETIKGLNLEQQIKQSIKTKYFEFIDNIFNFNKVLNIQNTLKDSIAYIGVFTIMFVGTILALNNEITLGTLFTYNALFLYFIDPIRNIIDLEPIIRHSYSSIKRIGELYEIDKEELINTNIKINGNIEFKNLSFTYNDKDYILKNINVNIKNKEKILIVGQSGSGKSTLVKLLLGYYKPNQNQLILDDKDINYYKKGDLRNNISYVSQNETLLTDTIYNNIKMNRNINSNLINDINKMVLVDEIIKKSPLGYNLVLEENGFNISGGERQRIILARSLLKNSNILILDESTNQIDLKKERTIFCNILQKYKEKTIIVISHRKENSDLFDRVITLTKEGAK